MTHKKWTGIIILALVVLGFGASFIWNGQQSTESIIGYIGDEKINFLENEHFKKQAKRSLNLIMDYKKVGSIEMVTGSTEGLDYLFPSSQLAANIYVSNGGHKKASDTIFYSPIVLYSRKPIVNALIDKGLVSQHEGAHYIDMQKLADRIVTETHWIDMGLPTLDENILVETTDPNESNSGMLFLGLLVNALNDNQPVDMASAQKIAPELRKIYQRISGGSMQTSSDDLFRQFVSHSMDAYPIIAGYEHQLIEYAKLEAHNYHQVNSDIIMLYPNPTVFSNHVYIALTEQGELGLDVLKSEPMQQLSWEDHGFRSSMFDDTAESGLAVPGLAKNIEHVISLPSLDVMLYLMDSIK